MNTTQLLEYTTSSAKWYLSNRGNNESIDHLDGYLIEDIIQDSLEKILKSKVDPQTKTYIANTVYSVIVDISRRNRLPRLNADVQVADPELVPLVTSEEILGKLYNSLDTEDSQLFTEYHQTKLTIHDIAVLHGVSERTVKRRLAELSDVITDFLGISKES